MVTVLSVLEPMMNAKLSQQRFWPYYENGLKNMIMYNSTLQPIREVAFPLR